MTSLTIDEPSPRPDDVRARSIITCALWTAQVLLAVTFLAAGVSKLVMSGEDMTKDIDLPVLFLRFIGVCEVLGAIALVGPGVLNIRRGLTPLAAGGLLIIMIGATVITLATMGVAPALFPLGVGLLVAFVGYNRRAWFRAA